MINFRFAVLLPLILCPVALWCQNDTCDLQHHEQRTVQQHRSGSLPVLAGNSTDPELEASLTSSYNSIYFQTTSASPEQSLHTALDLA